MLTPGTTTSYTPGSSLSFVLSMTEDGLSVRQPLGGLGAISTYNGILFDDVNDTLPDFTTFTPTLDVASDLPGFDVSRVVLFENYIIFQLGGLSSNGDLDTAVVNFAVPEPAAAVALAALATPALFRRRG